MVAAMAYLCVEILTQKMTPDRVVLLENPAIKTASENIALPKTGQNIDKNKHHIIVKRNLFKVEVEDNGLAPAIQEVENSSPEKLEATSLDLVLWGTVTGGSDIYAVIEDRKVRQQALYQTGDSITGAKIKRISRHEVILTYQGRDQVLEIEVDDKNIQAPGMPAGKIFPGTGPVNNVIANELLNTISEVTDQAKFRPHFSEGVPDGLMVYKIRPNSVFSQMGIRNGDIVMDINGTPIISVEDGFPLMTELETVDNVKLTVSRRGELKEFFYPAKENADSTIALPEDKEKGDE